ncbi:MAG: hypothetical protein AB7O73_15340, partial [Bacteroidia bacterium]
LFFVIPENYNLPVFIRVFDPDCGGVNDENRGGFNSTTKFSVYGGNNAFNKSEDANRLKVTGYNSGNLLFTKTFGEDPKYDNQYYSFGPINPNEGQLISQFGGRVFKLVIEGGIGDDGNLYKFFLSSSPKENKAIEGGNAFTYEYTFRLHDKGPSISHIYPYIDNETVSVKINNFDFDNDALLRVVSVAKKGINLTGSNDNEWKLDQLIIDPKEKGSSYDIQIIKKKSSKDNNVAFFVTNQYGKFLPFFSVPIGGVPKYNYKIGVK